MRIDSRNSMRLDSGNSKQRPHVEKRFSYVRDTNVSLLLMCVCAAQGQG